MIDKILKKFIGSKHDREMKRIMPIAHDVNSAEARVVKMSDAQIRSRIGELKQEAQEGTTLDDMQVEVFSLVREAAKRTLGERHYDVQIIGGVVLHEGKIAEMRTGEGKTLVATLAVTLNALAGKGAHVVTVNDYLARRDSLWMEPIYNFLGLSVGVIQHDMGDAERQAAYNSDITYGTNNEFGFDFLRDNMKFDYKNFVQRGHHFAIVDEVDSILVDEARTPLIISGPTEESTEKYYAVDRLIPSLRRDMHFQVDEKARTVNLTEEGVEHCESLLKVSNLYDPRYIDIVHQLYQSLKAHALFRRDVDYMVKKGDGGKPEVVIVDEFTGRLMPGRRYSDGLHQALEAKEKVPIQKENQTLASITFQNYFRMYEKLGGMTGTAETEAPEFHQIYKLEVVVIPTNKPMVRKDFSDLIYLTENDKFKAAIEEIIELNKKGQPVLVGSVSIEKSEKLASMLRKRGIKHVVLNAKHHEKEAEIVRNAGQPGAVTIATNMAGRGTDIVLGPGVTDIDGLHILGTERHEARRIDNQLRGRSGRQGDPGTSRFYLSLEDDLMRIFGGDRLQGLMGRIGMQDGEPIEHKMVTKAIERAQKQVEGQHFEIRKHLLEYDDVMNKQREAFYALRREILTTKDTKKQLFELVTEILADFMHQHLPEDKDPRDWEFEPLAKDMKEQFGLDILPFRNQFDTLAREELDEFFMNRLKEHYDSKEELIPPEILRRYERDIMLYRADENWKNHLFDMDHLKEGIGLRGYGQRDPLMEYKKESFGMFQDMMARVEEQVTRYLFMLQPVPAEEPQPVRKQPKMVYSSGGGAQGKGKPLRKEQKTGRNAPCPCGSGKKYKKCCGA